MCQPSWCNRRKLWNSFCGICQLACCLIAQSLASNFLMFSHVNPLFIFRKIGNLKLLKTYRRKDPLLELIQLKNCIVVIRLVLVLDELHFSLDCFKRDSFCIRTVAVLSVAVLYVESKLFLYPRKLMKAPSIKYATLIVFI